MAEATTSTPEKEVTPEGEKGAITGQEPAGEPTTPDEKVIKLEAEVDRLTKLTKQSQDLQRQADKKARIEKIEKQKLERQLQRVQAGEEYIPPEVPEGETPVERELRLEARIGIQNLILENSEYQELLKKDITLREVLKNNPFALIGEYFDAQDAVEQIKEKLDDRVKQIQVQPKEEKEGGGKEFETGPTQPSEVTTPPKKEEKQPGPGGPAADKTEESILKKIEVI